MGARFKLGRPTASAKESRNNPTPWERLLWSRLKNSQLDGLKFTRQFPVAGFRGDFACRTAKLIVELDGSQHAAQREADSERTRRIEAQGYRVIRFWNNELTENLDGVLETILAVARGGGRAPTP